MPQDDAVFTTTFDDVDKTATEFGRLLANFPTYGLFVLLDNQIIGDTFVRAFPHTPLGYVQARKWAIDMDAADIDSTQTYEQLVDAHYKFVGDGSW